jgi:hypothetical protein
MSPSRQVNPNPGTTANSTAGGYDTLNAGKTMGVDIPSTPENAGTPAIGEKVASGVARLVAAPAQLLKGNSALSAQPVFGAPKPGLAVIEAEREIAAKAKQLGTLPGNAVGPIRGAANGYVQQYQGCDIYYSSDTGAHEVHGDICAKYNDLGAASGVLGLPTTDETGTADGRFNHFVFGSIYWTTSTGPMMVRGAVRDVWASQGWERGPLRYPVEDQYQMRTSSPATDPETFWCLFENGAILSSKDGKAVALAADIKADQLQTLVRAQFAQQMQKSPDNVGLHPQIDTLSIGDWSYGFWKSVGRKITYRLYGFHDNGLVAPDTNFTADVELGFDLVWPDQFSEPDPKTLVAGLFSVNVNATGLGSQTLADKVASGIHDGFYPPDGPDPDAQYVPAGWRKVTDIPTGAQPDGTDINVIGILITQSGVLQILVNPVPQDSGYGRQAIVQQTIDAYIKSTT